MIVRNLGSQPYTQVWQQMQHFTAERTVDTPDEIWLCEHPPVYTLGHHADPRHLLHSTAIPIVQTDRGGEVTYHGPGQLMMYVLMDLKRAKLGVKCLVAALEQIVQATLRHYGIDSHTRPHAPGVYVEQHKICSVGLRVKRGCTYHGLALNIDMDLSLFAAINPCGYQGLTMTDVKTLAPSANLLDLSQVLVAEWRSYINHL